MTVGKRQPSAARRVGDKRIERVSHPSNPQGIGFHQGVVIARAPGKPDVVIGVGAGKGDISNRMSAAYNDFVFAIIVEEYGLLGAVFIVILYLVLLTRGLMIIKACKRTFPLYLATGAVTLILLQALVNMGVSSGAIPVTGQPLPWISWGGTSQIFTAIVFGFLLSISAENQAELLKQDTSEQVEEDDYTEDGIVLNIEK